MPTGCTLPVAAWVRSLTKVSVMAVRLVDAAVDPERGVEAVGEEVAGDAGAGGLDVEAPGAGAALGDVGRDGPVLQELGAVVVDAAELAGVDDLLDQGDGGHAAVVVADEVGDAGLLDGGDHRLAFGGGAGEGLFGDDGLAGFGGGDGDLGVEVVGDADVDEVDVGAGDQLAPVGLGRSRSPSGRRRPCVFAASRPQAALRTGRRGRSKKFGAVRKALEWQRPMKP